MYVLKFLFSVENLLISFRNSISEIASGISKSDFNLIFSGIVWDNKSSIDFTPIIFSISFNSEVLGPICLREKFSLYIETF